MKTNPKRSAYGQDHSQNHFSFYPWVKTFNFGIGSYYGSVCGNEMWFYRGWSEVSERRLGHYLMVDYPMKIAIAIRHLQG